MQGFRGLVILRGSVSRGIRFTKAAPQFMGSSTHSALPGLLPRDENWKTWKVSLLMITKRKLAEDNKCNPPTLPPSHRHVLVEC